ncbi:MAG: sigma-70 family RNA polymerase sigma factor [Thermoanaerobaculia bacterium]|nr:sigma-70 family RNA polymerase sigma factor [Thermoanaerobaculia bacterium]
MSNEAESTPASPVLEKRMDPLFKMAVVSGAEASVRLHIKRGAWVNARDGRGMSLLAYAVSRGHSEICRLLLDAGADPMLPSDDGKDALTLAVEGGWHEAEAVIRRYLPSAHSDLQNDAPSESLDEFRPDTAADELDTSAWEADLESPPPPLDESCRIEAATLQKRIALHRPIDTDEDWSDVDIELPDVSFRSRLLEPEEEEARARLREMLLRAISAGRISLRRILEAAQLDDEEDPDQDLMASILAVFEDLGIEVDDSWMQEALETQDSEEGAPGNEIERVLDDAMAHLDTLTSQSNNPNRYYQSDARKFPLLSAADEVSLFTTMAEAKDPRIVDEAKQKVIEANLRLVIWVAYRIRFCGLDICDLIQLGNLGLMHAVEKFDHRKGVRFATYAVWWIRQVIFHGAEDLSRTIRVPARTRRWVRRLKWATDELESNGGRHPEIQELSARLGVEPAIVARSQWIPEEPISLDDSQVGTGGVPTFRGLDGLSPEEHIVERETEELIRGAVRSLPPRQRQVILLRFAIAQPIEHTLEEVGRTLGVTRERIRQIEQDALRNLGRLFRRRFSAPRSTPR